MKKLFLSLIAALIGVLSVGLQAQTTSLPQTSTAESPIWYDLMHASTVQTLGLNASQVPTLGQKDDLNKTQLFRFEKDGDGYAIINKNGKYLSTTMDSDQKVILSSTKSLWTLDLNTNFNAIAISTPAGGLISGTESYITIGGSATDEGALWYVNVRTEPLNEPVISDETNTVWYYLLNQRGYPNPTKNAITDMSATAAAADVPLMGAAVSATNNGQLWKFMMKDGQKVLVSKNGNYINAFSTNSSTFTAVELQSPNGSPGAWQISTGGGVMHVGNDLSVSAWSNGPESYHAIVSEGDYWGVELKAKIVNAEALLASAAVGTGVGQFTQASIDAFQQAIVAAKAIADNPASSGSEVTGAAATLTHAQTTFNSSVVMPILSTDGNDTWYYIRSTFDGYSVLKQPYATSREDERIGLTKEATGDTYLWKLKAGSEGKYIIENKIKVGSIQTVKPIVMGDGSVNEWTITYRGNGQFTLTAADGIEMHADQAGFVVNWNASPIENSASCWTFVEPKVDKAVLLSAVTTATTLKNNAVIGSKGGQYPQDAVTTLEAAITKAQAAYDNVSLTLDQFFIESNEIAAAIAAFKNGINPAHVIATETIAEKAYRLKYVGPGVNNGKYLLNPRTESENDVMASGGRPQAHFTDNADTATVAFKFMTSIKYPTYFSIHNDRGVSGLKAGGDYLDENGRMRPAIAFDTTEWSLFTLNAEDATLAAGTKVGLYSYFSKKYIVARADTAITTMSVDSLPALVFELVEIGPASVEESSNSTVKVIAKDGRIEVYGTENENFEIFTANGVRLNKAARLQKGAYIVRIDDKAYKVIVK